jgi:sterol desaturase/sphingolipid hydroxylase (fatty acid hydroxylase superfamily)
MMDYLYQLIEPLQSWLFQALVLPTLHSLGFMSYADSAYDATGIAVLGIAEVALIYALIRPIEALRPAERWTDRRGARVDVLYTLLYRSGALPLLFFLLLGPLLNSVDIGLRTLGYLPPNLEELIPGLQAVPLLAFCCYVVIIDFSLYWFHRAQHRLDWWWALHAVHHSQRQMSLWTDDRNHILDGLLHSFWLAILALLIGVPGAQFAAIIFLMKLVESLSHANVHFGFGPVGDRLLVSPRYHRVHHGIGVGHEGQTRGCNFATLFPVWDVLFRTANFAPVYPATGIRDQLDGADYGRGFLAQQGLALRRMWRAMLPARPTSP